MDHFAGLDVSVKETSVCVVDDVGKIRRVIGIAGWKIAIRRGIAGCCARATSGHAAAPPSAAMNSRRFTRSPRRRGRVCSLQMQNDRALRDNRP
jgi:hypothetical protein